MPVPARTNDPEGPYAPIPRAKTTMSVLAARFRLNFIPPLLTIAVRFAADDMSAASGSVAKLGIAVARRNVGLALTKVIGPLPKTAQGLGMFATSTTPKGPFWPTMVPPT